MTGESDNVSRTFRAAPLDGGYTNPALHDPVELGLYVELWMLCLDAFQLDGHCNQKYYKPALESPDVAQQPTFFPSGDVGPEVDVPEGPAAYLAAKPVLVSDPQFHFP